DCNKLFSARLARHHPVRIIAAHARRREVACQRTPALAEAKDGGTTASERDPDEAGQAEARPEKWSLERPSPPSVSARVHPDGEGLRDAACGTEVRSRQGQQDPRVVPYLAEQDNRRPLAATAGRAGLLSEEIAQPGPAGGLP